MVRTRSSSVCLVVTPTTSSSASQGRPTTRNRSLSASRPNTTATTASRRRGSLLLPQTSSSSESESESPEPETLPSSSYSSSSPPSPPSPAWCCTCLQVGATRCNLRTAWTAYASRPGEEHFASWLASKHMSQLSADDHFPVYLLMKLKRSEAAAALSEMFFGYPPTSRWAAVDGHLEPLLAFCRHAGVPWERPQLTASLPSSFSLDPAENYRLLVIEHFKLIVAYLLRHYFHYYNARPRLGVLELARLLNSMYGDLLALNGLTGTREYQFYFHAGWLEEFTRQHACYRRLVVFPPKFKATLVETEHSSATVLVHAHKLAPISASVHPDDAWEHCYISQLFYDPLDSPEEGGGLCDCGQAGCSGCFAAACLRCASRKCGVLCRSVMAYFEGDLLARSVPQYYHWRRQQLQEEQKQQKKQP